MDAYGYALMAFYEGNRKVKIKVESDIAETEYWPAKEFFHEWKDMNQIERLALEMCHGRTLDVGAGSGSHALWLQNHGIEAHAIDVSEGAVSVMQKRGLRYVEKMDFFNLDGRLYDSILMLMNGAGIIGQMDRIDEFFMQVKRLLAPGGSLILDSSDVSYLFLDDDGSVLVDLNSAYYGEFEYTMSFAGKRDAPFKWLFIDFDTLQAAAERNGMNCRKVYEDNHYQYLAELTFTFKQG